MVTRESFSIAQYTTTNVVTVPQINEAPNAPLSAVDLFAGAGGISEGFRQAGYKILAGTDSDPDACATFALNFSRAGCICGDIRTKEIRERIDDIAMRADVIVGGPPCQAYSQVRNHVRMIDDPRNSLYREFVDVVKDAQPAAFVMENVTGIDQMGVRQQIIDDLSLDGEYRVSAQIVDAADFGVPQTRKRLLFVGIHGSRNCEPHALRGSGATNAVTLVRYAGKQRSRYRVIMHRSFASEYVLAALSDPEDARVVTAAQAISDLDGLPVGHRDDEAPYVVEPASAYQRMMRDGERGVLTNVQVPRINADTELRLRGIPAGGNYRDLANDLLYRYITGQRWGQDNGSGVLSRRHFYAYRRLHPRIWAWTLNTKGDSVYHYRRHRALSVREFARLQSFPDRFVFTTDPRKGQLPGRHDGGPAHSRYRQAGNAVPPLLARSVALALREVLQTASADRQLSIRCA